MGIVAAADCSSISVGMDSGHYEGPLRIRLPVQLTPGASEEGAWSFEIPLPDPASQKLLSRLRSLLNGPLHDAYRSCLESTHTVVLALSLSLRSPQQLVKA